jgi:ribulose-5-phosphate 4-epimerase/fuculose-1-phosphate aldolase
MMILRDHVLLAIGSTVPAAFSALWTLQRACEIQLAAQATGQPLVPVTEAAPARSTRESFQLGDRAKAGEDLFEALRRKINALDPSYRSYRS